MAEDHQTADEEAVVNQEPMILGSKLVGETKWLKMSTITYEDRYGKQRLWDMISRSTKKKDSFADAVVILTVLSGGKLDEPHILLVKQWRPPFAKYTIEMPAGLIDPGESPEDAAIRELHEETGYTGVASNKSPSLSLSPGLSNESAAVVQLSIDLDDEKNQNPKQKLDEAEDISVLSVPIRGLTSKLKELDSMGCNIFFGLYSLALGLEIAHST
eukprot:m.95639 g.95639  ORF g.95639 m.95639 type:complete len:215 (+) comp16609_c0_seq1:267-911(+)